MQKRAHLRAIYQKPPMLSVLCNVGDKRLQKNDGAAKAKQWRISLNEERKLDLDRKSALRSREWRRNNPNHRNALTTLHKKAVKQRTPKWADVEAIKEFYKNRPLGYHVDHIYPLRGETMSGLHVLENLQYLPAKENLRKNKKILEEYV